MLCIQSPIRCNTRDPVVVSPLKWLLTLAHTHQALLFLMALPVPTNIPPLSLPPSHYFSGDYYTVNCELNSLRPGKVMLGIPPSSPLPQAVKTLSNSHRDLGPPMRVSSCGGGSSKQGPTSHNSLPKLVWRFPYLPVFISLFLEIAGNHSSLCRVEWMIWDLIRCPRNWMLVSIREHLDDQ